MNLSLKPNPLIALLLPGTLFITIIVFTCPFIKINNLGLFDLLKNNWNNLNVGSASLIIFIFTLLGFIMGEILDSLRDIIEEYIIERKEECRINWDFFFEGKKEKIINLEEWYYTYYELDFNSVIGIFIIFILKLFNISLISWIYILILFLISLILVIDIIIMRKEIIKLTKKNSTNGEQNNDN